MIALSLVKQQLRVFHDVEDELIKSYTDAALSAFESWANRILIDPAQALPEPPGNAIVLSKSIQQGALLLIGHWYANRETVTMGVSAVELPMATNALWKPHRWVNV